MKLLLHADVSNLGHLGDVVEVAEGYGRNYLLPQRLAVEPTEANVKAIAEERARQVEQRRLARQELVNAAKKVNDVEVVIKALANEQGHLFGSIGETEISTALQEQGLSVQSKHVVLAEHVRQLGTSDVKLRFAEDVEANIHVTVVRPEQDSDDSEPGSESQSNAQPTDGNAE